MKINKGGRPKGSFYKYQIKGKSASVFVWRRYSRMKNRIEILKKELEKLENA